MDKQCPDCGERKPLESFSPSSKNRDGRTTYCRPCMNVRHAAYRDARRGGPPTVHRGSGPVADRTVKWCAQCEQELPVSAFGRNRSNGDGMTAYCRPCHNAAGRASKDRAGGSRTYHLKRRYGLSAQDVDALVEAQGGLCPVCRTRTPEHVDHDHLTGTVRGVLCSSCNQGLGNFRDDAATLRNAIDYLETTTWQRTQVCTGVYRLTSPRPAARRSSTSSGSPLLISSLRDASYPPG